MKVICISAKARCVDKDTEFFNGKTWKPISEYEQGEKVLIYNEDRTASLETPLEFIKQPCEELVRFHNTRIDQCLSLDHTCVYLSSKRNLVKRQLSNIIQRHSENKNGFPGRFITTFDYSGEGISLTDAEIKVMCAVIADASFIRKTSRCYMNLKKERKKEEIRRILSEADIEYEEREYDSFPGYTRFLFHAPIIAKQYDEFWYNCNKRQLEIICKNVIQWDGHTDGVRTTYSTTNKKTADFIQFAFTACGYRASIHIDNRVGGIHKSICYSVQASKNIYVSLFHRRSNGSDALFESYKTLDGFSYCFRVSSGMLVLRRNNKIFVTGNCGKDTAADYMKSELEKKGYKVLIAHYADLVKYTCRTFFDWNGEKDAAGRHLLQYVGTDIVRTQNENYWVDYIADMLSFFESNWDYVLIPDTRFPNEIERMKEKGFEVISMRINRENFESELTEAQKNHISETALDNYSFDYVVRNTTLEEFYERLSNVLEHIKTVY